MPYFSGQGKVYVATAAAGVPGVFRHVGNCPILNVQLETDVLEHKEATTGQRLVDLRIIRGKTAKFSFTIEEFDKDNLALALYGASSTITGSTVVAEVFPTVAVGDYVKTLRQKLSSIVVKDSAGSPATLTLGTHYEITSADHGTIKFINLASFTQPFKIDYTYATVTNVNMFTQGFSDRWLKFDGLNTVDTNKACLIELFKCSFDPASQIDFINDDIMKFELNGGALHDATKAADAVLGTFGRMILT
ncbi:MAG: hypothetical protein M3436_01550 [Pseudomonadota bacterium]|nr:hypothetical protein [Pseudomonadota bacterium]